MKKIFFFDIDETLLPLGEEGISEKNIQAIKQLTAKGHDVYIATGKSLGMIGDVTRQLGVNNTITSNGNVIKEGNEIVFSYHIKEEDINKVYDMVSKTENVMLGGQGNNGAYLLTYDKEVYKKYVNPIFTELSISDLEVTSKVEENLYQLWILGEVDNVKVDLNKYDTFRWNEYGLDVIYKGTSKARAIKYLLENKYKGEQVDTYAFGDSLNDIQMFKLVDNAVAVSNAKEELKKVSNYICDNSTNEGVYNYLKEYKLID